LGFFTSGGKIQKPPNWNVHTMMPRQLREGLRRHPKGSRAPRLIVEQLPSIDVKDLHAPSRYNRTHVIDLSFRLPKVASAKVSATSVTFHHASLHRGQLGPTQTFQLKPIRTGFGIRHTFLCNCGRSVKRLYYHSRDLGCRRCINAIYACQAIDQRQRPILQLSKLESLLGDKAYRRYRRIRERLEKKLGHKAMLAKPLQK
jgi:hypothetical protein